MENNLKYAVGLMSGTSLDGVDAALVSISGSGDATVVKLLDFESVPMDVTLRKKILEASDPATSNVALITSLNFELGVLFSEAVRAVLQKAQFTKPLDFVASHGQTIYHMPNPTSGFVKSTLQIGDPSRIAYDHQTQVVFNFRVMDIVAGGEGAPLVPYSEYLLYKDNHVDVLLQNIGGIGNVTVLPSGEGIDAVWAFDTGPGNMMMNAATHYFYGEAYDKDGAYAAQGHLIEALFETLANDPYLDVVPPKSTGREVYGEGVVEALCQQYANRPNDVIHTLTYFTAYTIAYAYKRFILKENKSYRVVLGGGGAYNPVLVAMIATLLPEIDVITQEDLGHSSDAKEAIAFAILGNQTLAGLPANVPGATGAKDYVVLGQICPNPFPNR